MLSSCADDSFQSSLRLRDAELLQKDTELDEKRNLLNKTKARCFQIVGMVLISLRLLDGDRGTPRCAGT